VRQAAGSRPGPRNLSDFATVSIFGYTTTVPARVTCPQCASALNRPADIRIKSENKANGRNKTQRPVGATRHFH
jgi:hypothetical protein